MNYQKRAEKEIEKASEVLAKAVNEENKAEVKQDVEPPVQNLFFRYQYGNG